MKFLKGSPNLCPVFRIRVMGTNSSTTDVSKDSAITGSARGDFDKDSITVNNSFFNFERAGINWAICARKNPELDHLGIFLHMIDGDYELRSVDVACTVKLINHSEDAKTESKLLEHTFVKDSPSWGYMKFLTWTRVIDEQEGFVKDNKLTVEIEHKISNIVAFRKLRRVDVTDQEEPTQDVTLTVEGKEFYVSKQFLSVLSPVFHSMFYGNFAERNKKNIELKEIAQKDFTELINVIYPPHKDITESNVDCLLKLADRFQIDSLIKQCEMFLIISTKLSIVAKLTHTAGRCRLFRLQDHCIAQLKTTKEVRELKNSTEFKNLPDTVRLALFDKLMNLTD